MYYLNQCTNWSHGFGSSDVTRGAPNARGVLHRQLRAVSLVAQGESRATQLGTGDEERMLNAPTEVRREPVRFAGTDFCSALGRER